LKVGHGSVGFLRCTFAGLPNSAGVFRSRVYVSILQGLWLHIIRVCI
jgi:hypothetical protein